MKVLIGAFAHESNDFCPGFTTREMFEFYEGQDVLDPLPVSDIFQKAGIEMVPSIFACAQSYGPVEKETYLYFEGKILDTLRQNPDIDGIWMFCHGAMNVEEIGSGEYRLACDMREITGDRCAISFGMDLHGNLEEDFCRQVNIFRCYHTAPHTDQADTYRRTAQTLVHYLQHGYRIFPQMRKLPMIFPGEMAATTVEPMQGIIAQLKQWEASDPAIACASMYVGFAWTDAPRTSSTVVVVPATPEDEAYCAKKADELAAAVFDKRKEFCFEMPALPPRETVEESFRLPAPVCVTDMGDNPTAGTTGGSLVLLKEYLAAGSGGKRVLIAGIYDPQAFSSCIAHSPGDVFTLRLGLDIDSVTQPVDIRVIYRGCHKVLGYDFITNPPIERCQSCTVSIGNIDIVITNRPYAFTQKVNFSSCQLDPRKYDVFVTKFGYIFPELKELGRSYIMSNTPGESYQMIAELPYRKIKRPIFPLDHI